MTDKLSKAFSILFVAFDQRFNNQDIQTATVKWTAYKTRQNIMNVQVHAWACQNA